MMLVGIIYLYTKTPDQSFALSSFYNVKLSYQQESWVFWLFFIAFAVKMPIFPFHTWQPDTYEQSPTATTMVLSGIMVKMGVFGVIRWLVPVLPTASWAWGDTVSTLCVVGMIYASLIAIQQDDLKAIGCLFFYCTYRVDVPGNLCNEHSEYAGCYDTDVQSWNKHHRLFGSWLN